MPHFKCWSVMSHSHDAHSSRPRKHDECALYTLLFHLGCTKHDQHMWAISVRFAHPSRVSQDCYTVYHLNSFKFPPTLFPILGCVEIQLDTLGYRLATIGKFTDLRPRLDGIDFVRTHWISFRSCWVDSKCKHLQPKHQNIIFPCPADSCSFKATKSQDPVSMTITAASFWGRAGVRGFHLDIQLYSAHSSQKHVCC